ncbi:hypothetical protein BCR36DRAFT_585721 [Piromyces finnis]|uniref:Ankyrin n=1 Tax=Piromyces finnis TaxID=1754191 RepID=A0A1Y1V360_9FUNG|nr:hypothetical protein BCR36DRAFT_585721 [Piromyces finnis]|eukprot:ORX45409.1 hypothetical protein BCR36DRAFT_585721 [Piromyces finnis]
MNIHCLDTENVSLNDAISSIINNNFFNKKKLLYLICSNELGVILESVINHLHAYEIFSSQDDDGNTPLHLLCQRVDHSEDYDNVNKHMKNLNGIFYFNSEPTYDVIVNVIETVYPFADFSIKNKNGFTPDELTKDLKIHKFFYLQMMLKINGMFPKTTKEINFQRNNYYSTTRRNINEKTIMKEINCWNMIFKLKDPKRKNKTLLHFLLGGDRLGAIQFLVEHGADMEEVTTKNEALSYLFQITSNNLSIYNANKRNLPTRHIQDYLKPFEKKIVLEIEKIAEYIVNQGETSIWSYGYNQQPYFDISDIMYRLYKKHILMKEQEQKEQQEKDNEGEDDNEKEEEENEEEEDEEKGNVILNRDESNSIIENENTQLKINLPTSLMTKLKELSLHRNKSVKNLCIEILQSKIDDLLDEVINEL